MKELLKAADIRNLIGSGEKVVCVSKDAIITPEAKDLAVRLGITIRRGQAGPGATSSCQSLTATTAGDSQPGSVTALDQNSIARIVEQVVAAALPAAQQQGPTVERDAGGLLLVRGKTVVLEPFNTGHSGDRVGIREILGIKESPNMSSGFMSMEKSSFDWTLKYDEIDYIVEGVLEFTVNGKTYSGQAGDVFYIPCNSSVTFSAPGKVKFFYVTYPANWAELSDYGK
jgi:ethanolamine utilization protein EutQ